MTGKSLVNEKITRLLETEDEKVRRLAFAAINMAQTRRLPAEALAMKLYQQLDRILKEEEDET